ncbi:pilus assembly protein PilY [Psychrobacter sp. S4(2024)]|uniref:pilus assembly protein PilY n=1 Tax=Psychrobacter sp. S4(2024) TaxID=3111913 RepID=UPI002FE3E13C
MKNLPNEMPVAPLWRTKALSSAVLLSLAAMMSQTAGSAERKPIGDLEIYQSAKGNGASIFMMIDVSASMGKSSIETDYNNKCDQGGGKDDKGNDRSYGYQTSETITAYVKDENGNYIEVQAPRSDGTDAGGTFTPKGCQAQNGGAKEFDRLSRLQMALIELFSDRVERQKGSEKVVSNAGSLPNEYAIGTGIFGYGDGKKAKVISPLGPLTAAKRSELIQEIAKLSVQDNNNKPVSQALAEAGAYMMGTTTKTDSSSGYSGFDDSVDSAKNDAKSRYVSPLKAQQCSGDGIYLLTDGAPSGSNPTIAKSLMNKSLEGSSLSVANCNAFSLPAGADTDLGCMAEYTQKLRQLDNPIKTAVAGYGDAFKGLTKEITVDGKKVKVANCTGTASADASNLCKIGERFDDNPPASANVFGNGGFYYIAGEKGVSQQEPVIGSRSSEMIAKSIVDFAATLTQVIDTAPSGTITVPEDPYKISNQLPYAYLPMLEPDIASGASIWKGNLKKYNLKNGTLYGKANNTADTSNSLDNLLYKDVSGRLNESTRDIWQSGDFQISGVTANNEIEAGGVYAQLSSPSSEPASIRTLYVEDVTSATNSAPTLRKLSVNSEGVAQGFNNLIDPIYDELNKRRLLSFLGFNQVLDLNGDPTDNTAVAQLKLVAPASKTTPLGGVIHSKPTAVSYSSTLNDNGRIINPRDDYALFGSMDGALHLVDADKGQEKVAIIPKAMLETQPEALVSDSKTAKLGVPYFGVDAPWLVTTDYNYNLTGKKVTVDKSTGKGMFAYGGLRMGGEGLYGIDITNTNSIDPNLAVPKMLFTITPAGLASSTPEKSTTIGFGRIGQIWSKPVEAKIRMTKDDKPIDVLIFGGGYDMQYETDSYVATSTAPAKGNAIYMINAKTGALIWSTSKEVNSGSKVTSATNANMIHSITGGITVLDRDNDGLMDHLYAADLGGQVFRADFENARPNKFGFSEVASFSNKRLTRILNTTPTDSKFTYRFYERPVVSFYRNEGGPNNGKIFAMVNVISGNRSAPLSTLRNNDTHANRVYGIIDSDVTKTSLYDATPTLTVQNLTEGNLTNLATELGVNPDEAKKKAAKAAMIAGTKQGWFYPLTRFDGFSNVRYNKGVGDSVVINDLLYTTVYNPDKQYYEVNSCTAKIAGGSERQLYCLPYGICMDDTSKSGTGGYVPAGQGIQELTLGAYDAANTDIKVLIGTTTLDSRVDATNRTNYGIDTLKDGSNIKNQIQSNSGSTTSKPVQAGGDGSAAEFLFNERYTLQPRAWYKQTQ